MQLVRSLTGEDIEFILLVSIQSGLIVDTAFTEPTQRADWRAHITETAVGPMNEERALLLLVMTRCSFRRGNNWGEHLERAMASVEVLGIMLEVAVYEGRSL